MRTRIGWASGVAVLGLGVALILSGVSGAGATQGDPVLAGLPNTATMTTSVHNTAAVATCAVSGNDGLQACGDIGVHGLGNTSGVYGETTGGGYGVLGYAPSAVAVRGKSANGTGVVATASNSGTALKVKGKAQFSRSGLAVVPNGQSSVTVSNVALGAKSMVFATAQGFIPPGTYARAAVPDVNAQTITIYMNTTMTADLPVAWFIVERP